jgi:hypothetical protein
MPAAPPRCSRRRAGPPCGHAAATRSRRRRPGSVRRGRTGGRHGLRLSGRAASVRASRPWARLPAGRCDASCRRGHGGTAAQASSGPVSESGCLGTAARRPAGDPLRLRRRRGHWHYGNVGSCVVRSDLTSAVHGTALEHWRVTGFQHEYRLAVLLCHGTPGCAACNGQHAMCRARCANLQHGTTFSVENGACTTAPSFSAPRP